MPWRQAALVPASHPVHHPLPAHLAFFAGTHWGCVLDLCVAAKDIAVPLLECRRGDDDCWPAQLAKLTGGLVPLLATDLLSGRADDLEPRQAVLVGQGNAGAHLGDVGGGVQVIAVDEGDGETVCEV